MFPKERSDRKHQQYGCCRPRGQCPPELRLIATSFACEEYSAKQQDHLADRNRRYEQVETIVVGVGDNREQEVVFWAHAGGEHLRDVYPLFFIGSRH